MGNNLKGKIYDGRWMIVGYRKCRHTDTHFYVARNIFNNNVIKIYEDQLEKIERGEINVGHVIRRKMWKDGKFNDRTFVFQK